MSLYLNQKPFSKNFKIIVCHYDKDKRHQCFNFRETKDSPVWFDEAGLRTHLYTWILGRSPLERFDATSKNFKALH